MAVLTFPLTPIASVVWRLQSHSQVFRSPLTNSRQVLDLPGAMWAAEIQFVPVLDQAAKRELRVFLIRLRGQSGKFRLSEPGGAFAGSGAGVPVVDQAISNTAVEIGVSGMTPSANGVFLAGDMIGFDNDELKMVVEDVDADINGEGTIKVEPPFRVQPSDASSIVTSNPTCVMSLVDDAQAAWALSPGGV